MSAAQNRIADVCIAGAGIIGLALALELHHRGLHVTVLDRATPLGEASTAAAGMLAAADPYNPPQLRSLADLSLALYPAFLQRIHDLSGRTVPFQTHTTLQSLPADSQPTLTSPTLTSQDLAHLLPSLHPGDHRFTLLDEHSIDPRQLAPTLLAAVQRTSIELHPHTPVVSTEPDTHGVTIHTTSTTLHAQRFVDCTGSWSSSVPGIPLAPRKGQMLYLTLPSTFPLHFVLRTHDIYIVPRTFGPNAGRALIGATVEDTGFDKSVHAADIRQLHAHASLLLPTLAPLPPVETWSGLRPATADQLPLLGPHPTRPNHFLATGHYRNGILLAPATALLLAQLLTGEPLSADLSPFSPARGVPALA